ncbi:MAG: ABC-type transport auxiliary lipoprotein family protein [Methylocystis sp.]
MGKSKLKSTSRPGKRAAAALVSLALVLAGCASAPRETFDLSGASSGARSRFASPTGVVAVAEPVALQPVASDRLVVRGADGDLAVLSDAQWSDRLPRLAQARLIDRLRAGGVDATLPGAVASYELTSELRRFEIDASRGIAVVEIVARLSNDRDGARRGEAIFVGEAPAPHTLGPDAVRALDAALNRAMDRLLVWTRARI